MQKCAHGCRRLTADGRDGPMNPHRRLGVRERWASIAHHFYLGLRCTTTQAHSYAWDKRVPVNRERDSGIFICSWSIFFLLESARGSSTQVILGTQIAHSQCENEKIDSNYVTLPRNPDLSYFTRYLKRW
jgi:hypothetical protein